ncbi:MerR family transcriptional regulator [Streptomyces sp. NPDC059696]|uniref:MerR family transcriptional regulator n=1 Tax=Streptomyces sp. NPDC059696 TaxID=3346911 RepID=UPI00367A0315
MGAHERDSERRGREGAPLGGGAPGGKPPGGGAARAGGGAGGGLTTGEVARRLGVAPTTVRTWDRRYGLGPDGHTGGRHRRWTPSDVARLERMCALTATGIPPAEAARAVLTETTQRAEAAGGATRAARRTDTADTAGGAGAADTAGGASAADTAGGASAADTAGGTSAADTAGRAGAAYPAGGAIPAARPRRPGGRADPASREALMDAAPDAAPDGAAQDLPTAGQASRPRPSAPARRSRAGSGLRLGDVRQECKGIARAALRLDASALDDLLATAIAEHGLVAAWTEVIMPTLQAVGRKWENSGEKYIEVEHFLSWHVSGALRRGAPPAAADRPGATVVLACVPGENHTLPLEVLSAALAERGLPVRMFGGALPVESLVTAVRRTGPAAVGLWAQSRTTASRPLAQHVAAMEWGVRGARRKPVVLTIGPGWSGRTVPGLPRPTGLAEAVAVLESVVSR